MEAQQIKPWSRLPNDLSYSIMENSEVGALLGSAAVCVPWKWVIEMLYPCLRVIK